MEWYHYVMIIGGIVFLVCGGFVIWFRGFANGCHESNLTAIDAMREMGLSDRAINNVIERMKLVATKKYNNRKQKKSPSWPERHL